MNKYKIFSSINLTRSLKNSKSFYLNLEIRVVKNLTLLGVGILLMWSCRDEEVAKSEAEEILGCVDLGLSVKWATCNLGAENPEEFGNYYAWGENDTFDYTIVWATSDISIDSQYGNCSAWGESKVKSVYNWNQYEYCNGTDSTLTKYCTNGSYGIVDNIIELEESDDAAYNILGESWRMPTDAEWTELRENCTWTWMQKNGVNGYEVTGKNGNSIFLPAAGYRNDTSILDIGYEGRYWSKSLREDKPIYAWGVRFSPDYKRRSTEFYRYFGRSVRPVFCLN